MLENLSPQAGCHSVSETIQSSAVINSKTAQKINLGALLMLPSNLHLLDYSSTFTSNRGTLLFETQLVVYSQVEIHQQKLYINTLYHAFA